MPPANYGWAYYFSISKYVLLMHIIIDRTRLLHNHLVFDCSSPMHIIVIICLWYYCYLVLNKFFNLTDSLRSDQSDRVILYFTHIISPFLIYVFFSLSPSRIHICQLQPQRNEDTHIHLRPVTVDVLDKVEGKVR